MRRMAVKVWKNLAFTRVAKSNKKIYIMNFFNDIIHLPIRFLILTLVWSAIFGALHITEMHGMSKWDMVYYYFLITLIGRFARYYKQLPYTIWTEITKGEMSKYLCRPMNYLSYQFWYGIGSNYYDVILNTILILPIWLMRYHVDTVSLLYLPLFFVTAILSVLITYFVYTLLGLLTFWTESIFGYRDFILHIGAFFSGSIIPLNFLPDSLCNISYFLPFRYMLHDPVTVLMGNLPMHDAGMVMARQVIMVLILAIITSAVWHRGICRYEALGG